jgi:hypothetical protein
MMNRVERDERTISVENASYRWAYHVLSYGLLLIVAYRAFARGEPSWDLLALVILGGATAMLWQGRERVLSRRWSMLTVVGMLIAAVVGAALVFVL